MNHPAADPATAPTDRMVAVLVARGGELPEGWSEAVAEAGGRVVVVGEGAHAAAAGLTTVATEIDAWETPGFAPAAWARAMAPFLAGEDVVILPASPDGRDLAPHLAAACERPLVAGAIAAFIGGARVSRRGGLIIEDLVVNGPFVATLIPGCRAISAGRPSGAASSPAVAVYDVRIDLPVAQDPRTIAILPADPATVDLAEAPRLIAGGGGLGSAEAFDLLGAVGLALGAAMGGTRVVTDLGWLPTTRQIGTTGVAVDPRLYIAFGISGAVQHVAGLGQPDHVLSVNLDPHCPMMSMSDLAIVANAPATLEALAVKLGVLADKEAE